LRLRGGDDRRTYVYAHRHAQTLSSAARKLIAILEMQV
jgi:hypothetical protein